MPTRKILRLFLLVSSCLSLSAVVIHTLLFDRRLQSSVPLRYPISWFADDYSAPNITAVMLEMNFSVPEVPCRKPLVPRILHLVWLDHEKRVFRFHHFISVVSALIFFRPAKIMFWFDPLPMGIWWKRLVDILHDLPVHNRPRLVMLHVDSPQKILEENVYYVEHQTDIVRLKSLLQHGGVYMDLDVVMVNDIGPLLCYPFTIGEESPNGLCNGFMAAIPGAPFLKIWYDAYNDFQPMIWNYNSVQQPGQLALKYPKLVHVENSTINHPNWGAEIAYLYEDRMTYDWKTKNYVLHLWYRKHNIDYGPRSIMALNNTLGEVFRYIYYGITPRMFKS